MIMLPAKFDLAAPEADSEGNQTRTCTVLEAVGFQPGMASW